MQDRVSALLTHGKRDTQTGAQGVRSTFKPSLRWPSFLVVPLVELRPTERGARHVKKTHSSRRRTRATPPVEPAQIVDAAAIGVPASGLKRFLS